MSLVSCDTKLAARWRASPNFQPRRNGLVPNILLMHYTGMESAKAALDHLCHEQSGVSCHYLVDEEGQIIQMVAESQRAWHAGQSHWAGQEDINSCSIGIEIVHEGHIPEMDDFPDRQIEAVIALSRDIFSRHAIPPRHVLAHSDVAPERKKDPGEKFPWRYLHEQGIGHYVSPVAPKGETGFYVGDEDEKVEQMRKMLRNYGYKVDSQGPFDQKDADLITAFQRHFRPQKVDGRLDQSTFETAQKLVDSLSSAACASA